jgi:hypothetical protein
LKAKKGIGAKAVSPVLAVHGLAANGGKCMNKAVGLSYFKVPVSDFPISSFQFSAAMMGLRERTVD